MTPLSFWILVITVNFVYRTAKYYATGEFEFEQMLGCILWVGYSMIALHFGWVEK